MKKIILLVLILALSSILFSCKSRDDRNYALEVAKKYVQTLSDRDLDEHLKIMKDFELDRDVYNSSFFSHVKSAKFQSADIVHQTDSIIIVELKFMLELDDNFVENGRLSRGEHEYTRYLTFKVYKDMALTEILDKLIK